jgi:hypothetical protein
MKVPRRSRRRADLERMKAKAVRLHPEWEFPQMYAEHLATCSCWMCGNPRRYFKGDAKITMQERKAQNEENTDE